MARGQWGAHIVSSASGAAPRSRWDSTLARIRADDRLFTLAVTLVALIPRLFVAIAWTREPVWDGHYYHFGAERIAQGFGYSEDVAVAGALVSKPWCHYPVGYSALLAVFYLFFGSGLLVAPLVNTVIGVLTVAVAHRIARRYLSENRARIAATVIALHPGLIAYTAVVMTEPLAALLLLAALWAPLHWRGQWLGLALGGVAIGFATLVRPSSLLAAPLLVATQPRPWWQALGRSAVGTGLAVLLVLPWTLRNCRVMDGCALVSTNGGWNLAIGALTETGRFVTLRAEDGCAVVTGQVQQDRCWAKVGRSVIWRDPWRWISLMPRKLAQTYNHESFPIEYLHQADPAVWPASRREAARDLLSLYHRLVVVLAVLCAVARVGWRNGRWAHLSFQGGLLGVFGALAFHAFYNDYHPFHWLVLGLPLVGMLPLPGRPWQGPVGYYLLGLLLITSITHAVFFGDDRYHIVVAPALCLLAAAALRRPEESWGSHGA